MTMDDATEPETEVAETSAGEQEFSDFEKSIEQPAEAKPDVLPIEEDNVETEEDGDPTEDNAPSEPDFADVEYEGKNYKLPPELKDALLRQSDYSRKMNAQAERERVFEAQQQVFNQTTEAEMSALMGVARIDTQLERYAALTPQDWEQWDREDSNEATKARLHVMELQRAREAAAGEFQSARTMRQAYAEREAANRRAEGARIVAEKIPDWSDEKDAQLTKFALDNDFAPEELKGLIADPRLILMLDWAYRGFTSQKKQQQAAKAVKAQEVKPVPTLKGNQGRQTVHADTNDFAAFEKLADAKIRSRR